MVTILAIDSSLTATGIAVWCGGKFDYAEVITTKPAPESERLRKSEDWGLRVQDIHKRLRHMQAVYAPSMVVCEAYSQPRAAAAAVRTAAAMAAVWCLGLPVRAVSPQAMKRFLCGQMDASKAEVAAEMDKRHPEIAELLKGIKRRTLHEHVWDASAALETWLATAEGRAWIAGR